MSENIHYDTITLGGGCFWCLETVFNRLNGVVSAISGYTGGNLENPTYEQVCTGTTGHVEVVQITYNTAILSTAEILKVFFTMHDPTQYHRQGDDIGEQYRTVVFYHHENQRALAQEMIEGLEKSGIYTSKIQTTVEPLKTFYNAEAYHQDYFNQNSQTNRYCALVVKPKVEKFEKIFDQFLKKK